MGHDDFCQSIVKNCQSLGQGFNFNSLTQAAPTSGTAIHFSPIHFSLLVDKSHLESRWRSTVGFLEGLAEVVKVLIAALICNFLNR